MTKSKVKKIEDEKPDWEVRIGYNMAMIAILVEAGNKDVAPRFADKIIEIVRGLVTETQKQDAIELDNATRKERQKRIVERQEYARHLKKLINESKSNEEIVLKLAHFILKEEEHLGI